MSEHVEVPLTGELGKPVAAGDGDRPRPRPRRRLLVGLAVSAGAVLAVVVAITLASGADEDAAIDGPSTSAGDVTGTLPPTVPTVPPTLAPTLPTMDGESSPAVALPDHPEVGVLTVDVEFAEGAFDLDTALRRATDDRPRRGVTTIVAGTPDDRLDVVVTRAPGGDRYRLLIDDAPRPVEFIVDLELGFSYVSVTGDDWRRLPNDDVVLGPDAGDLRAFLDLLLFGPVREDTVIGGSVTPGRYVLLTDGSRVARRYDIVIDAGAAPLWSRYRLGASADAPSADAGEPFTLAAYVDEWGDLVQVDGIVASGTGEQLSLHTLTVLPSDYEIGLPEVASP